MHWSVSPLAGKTTDWRAVCGKFASPVRREGASKPIDASYPYHVCVPGMALMLEVEVLCGPW
jgi:hypothetical protein